MNIGKGWERRMDERMIKKNGLERRMDEKMRKENNIIKRDLSQKEKELDEALDSITVLNTRINLMITIKFMNIVERY